MSSAREAESLAKINVSRVALKNNKNLWNKCERRIFFHPRAYPGRAYPGLPRAYPDRPELIRYARELIRCKRALRIRSPDQRAYPGGPRERIRGASAARAYPVLRSYKLCK